MKKLLLIIAIILWTSTVIAAPAVMYVTPAGAGAKDGAAWDSAFGEAEFEADLEANAEAGDIYYVKAGTYTLDSAYDASAKDGTSAAPISIIGVKAATTAQPPTVSDWGSSTDRPTFEAGGDSITVGDYYKVYNLIITGNGTGTSLFTGGTYNKIYNVKSNNSSGTAGKYAIIIGSSSHVTNCEAQSAAGIGIVSASSSYVTSNYVHDCGTVCISVNAGNSIIGNIVDTCGTNGLSITSNDSGLAMNNTIYNVATGINATDAYGWSFVNNVIDTATDGFKWTSQIDSNFFAYNHTGDSVTDMWDTVEESVSAHKDVWVTSGSPAFTNAAGGDFSFAKNAACVGTGMAISLGTSTAGKINQGAYQMTQNPAGGASASAW